MIQDNSSHTAAIAANHKVFDEAFANKYENTSAMKLASCLLANTVLKFDVSAPRKTTSESEQLVGASSSSEDGFGLENLPSPSDFHREFPHSVIKPGIKLMDFACGTGLFTQKLFPYLRGNGEKESEVVGIDISRPFLTAFEAKAQAEKAKNLTISSHLYDILAPETQVELDAKFGTHFDVIVCTISYHHIENYRDVTKKLGTFLKPGGWLFILDFYNEDVEFVANSKNVTNAVRHMGGLKIDSMNDTLGTHSGLTKVSSAREARTRLWQAEAFIRNHLNKQVNDDLDSGKLESKVDATGEVVYLVEISFIMAVGQAKPA